jgi:hypothetical protein
MRDDHLIVLAHHYIHLYSIDTEMNGTYEALYAVFWIHAPVAAVSGYVDGLRYRGK